MHDKGNGEQKQKTQRGFFCDTELARAGASSCDGADLQTGRLGTRSPDTEKRASPMPSLPSKDDTVRAAAVLSTDHAWHEQIQATMIQVYHV